MYSILLDDGKEKKTGKGIKKCILKKNIAHDDYKNTLFSNVKEDQRKSVSFNNLRSKDHTIYMLRITKTGLSCYDDKRYLQEDGISSYAYGHYRIKT
jgi:hypothetical protein